MDNKEIIIIGAGPAGLAAGNEFVKQGLRPIILEKNDRVGGLARTESYKGYYFDLGGHRFFTKNHQINRIWHRMLGEEFTRVSRMSRIYYNGRFYNYPLEILNVLFNLGLLESILIPLSYIKYQIKPLQPEEDFDQWITNRFGRRLYETFFQAYTEKVWGIPCTNIRADWAAQRIRNLSLIGALINALLGTQEARTLINEFDYPLKGPGMMWHAFQEAIVEGGGQILLDSEVTGLKYENGSITGVEYVHANKINELPVRHLISSMPVSKLVFSLKPNAPDKVLAAADSLSCRSFIIVILIVNKKGLFPDQWIYIHSPQVKVGRIQNFKNWSAAMVPDLDKTSIGMEYFCSKGDEIWDMSDVELVNMASRELSELGFSEDNDILDSCVARQADAYPVYDGKYKEHLSVVRGYLGTIGNLQTIGRGGTHRYNNMDHSMLAGMLAVKNYFGANKDLWDMDDEEYLEEDKQDIDRRIVLENILGQTFAGMDKLAFATAVGAVSGLLIFLATIWLVIKGGPVVGPNLKLLSQYFIGYTVTVKGAFIAFGYSFFWGFLFGWLFAYLRNLCFGVYLYWIRKKTEILTLKDFFDYI
ncbi:MAG: NAD(P)/FAD-dependent oxidoreductase [Deltaproteobacteria bacterium]|nr:NAD(P)/FAD-dependent oxidoreductase [Deltaproteobacteria bacterium]